MKYFPASGVFPAARLNWPEKGWKRREGERLLLPRGLKQRLLKMRNGGVPPFDKRPGNRENRMFQKLTVQKGRKGGIWSALDSLKRLTAFILFYLA